MRGVVGALVVLATAAVGVPAASAGTYDVVRVQRPRRARGQQLLALGESRCFALGAISDAGRSSCLRPHRQLRRPPTALGAARTRPCTDSLGDGCELHLPGARRHAHHAGHALAVRRRRGWAQTIPSSPDNESGRFETNATFGDDVLSAERCHPGDGFYANPCTIGAPGFTDASQAVYDGRATSFKIGIFCGGDNGPFIACYTNDGAGGPYGFIDLQGARGARRGHRRAEPSRRAGR